MNIEHDISLNGDYIKPLNELINEESRLFIHDLNHSSDSHDFIIELEDIYNRYQNLRGFSLSLFIDNDYFELKPNINFINNDLNNKSLIIIDIHEIIERFCYSDNVDEYKLNIKQLLIDEFDLKNRENRYALYDKILFNNSRANVYPLLSNILQKKYNFKINNNNTFYDDILIINNEEIPVFETQKSPWKDTLQLFYQYKDISELAYIDRLFQDKKADTLYLKNSVFCPVYKKNGKFFITMTDYELSEKNSKNIDYPYQINKNYDKKSMQTLSSLFFFLTEEEIELKLKEFDIKREKIIIKNSLSNTDILINKKNRI